MTIVGTRPEIIRLSQVIPKLDRHFDQVLVHTGQNYDYELNEIFFDELGVRRPDAFMQVDTSSVGSVYAGVIARSEQLMIEHAPDAVVILGDTNSAVSAMMARRLGIPILHMEAGNRCFDWRVPEEMNRRIVDHISNINLVYTEHARRNLLGEGVPANTIVKTGSPMNEVLAANRDAIAASTVLDELGLDAGRYFVASLHREENVDGLDTCRGLFAGLREVQEAQGYPVVVSVHPRTRNRLEQFGITETDGLRFLKPFGFHAYNRLQMNSTCVISDSGTISEEAALLGFSAVSPRTATERPEGIEAGVFRLCDRTPEAIQRAVAIAIARRAGSVEPPADYMIPNTSDIVAGVVQSVGPR